MTTPAEHAMLVINEQVEMCQEVLAQQPTDLRVRELKLGQTLHSDNGSFDGVRTHLEKFQSSQFNLGKADTRNQADVTLGRCVKFGRKRRLNDCDLGPGIQLKFKGAGSVNGDRNTYLRTIQ